ncbi:pyridoxal phosphate-dependent decarboxylase family protein [Commensalibacter melissae]|uniref:pyridoxal phosphate-dependent decarboxylase family protein n=1 Tax=Commensalibacter melissae TaxID=2070537 RepID=UPI0012D96155|nr:aminotransferase class V-fold PLP-dependent enzyme [Commensalibacter melissae]MUG80942.1 aminotransferase class V-fold PLP-dependent enzyme [Commensalibacter melissae]
MNNYKVSSNKIINKNNSILYDAFNPNNISFLFEKIQQKLYKLLQDKTKKGIHCITPHELLNIALHLTDHKSGESIIERLNQIVDLHINTAIKVNSTGYMARQFSSVIPVSAIYDVVNSLCPQPASFYECGPLPNVADKIIAEKFAKFLGWENSNYGMISTSGASLANLTAVITARNNKYPNIWKKGNAGQKNLVPTIAIGTDAHFSVSRIAGIIGLGQDNIILLPLNAQRQICIKQARQILNKAHKNGKNIFCIIAAAGSTSIGAIDPLKELSELAIKYKAWFHVDAAHSGSFLVSDQLRNRVAGLTYADSFCLDAHKTLFVPAACTLLFYKNGDKTKLTFPIQASYVTEEFEDEITKFESGTKNFECTKRPSILNLWVVWSLYGQQFFATKLNLLVKTTFQAYKYLQTLDNFETLHKPESNILCFRYLPNEKKLSKEKLNYLQLKIRDKIRVEGRYFISKVDLDHITALRIVIMNHEISMDDIADLTKHIETAANSILKTF